MLVTFLHGRSRETTNMRFKSHRGGQAGTPATSLRVESKSGQLLQVVIRPITYIVNVHVLVAENSGTYQVNQCPGETVSAHRPAESILRTSPIQMNDGESRAAFDLPSSAALEHHGQGESDSDDHLNDKPALGIIRRISRRNEHQHQEEWTNHNNSVGTRRCRSAAHPTASRAGTDASRAAAPFFRPLICCGPRFLAMEKL